jgi:hypothetical protein
LAPRQRALRSKTLKDLKGPLRSREPLTIIGSRQKTGLIIYAFGFNYLIFTGLII